MLRTKEWFHPSFWVPMSFCILSSGSFLVLSWACVALFFFFLSLDFLFQLGDKHNGKGSR